MKITLVQRRKFAEQYSIESYFDRVADSLRMRGENVIQYTVPNFSKGIVPRVRNTLSIKGITDTDVIHVTGDIHYVALGGDPQKTIVTVHDCGTLDRLHGLKRFIFKLFWYQLPLNHAAAITVVSQVTKDCLMSYVPSLDSNKVHVIPTSVSEDFVYSPKEFSREQPRILQVGTRANKNVLRVIKALNRIRCKLVLIGSLNAEIKTALETNRVEYENLVGVSHEELIKQYRMADIVSFPSTLEGFGMPIVEAQLTGRPVLTSNISSMPEVAGLGAVLVNPYCVDSIRAGFLEIIANEDRRAELIVLGRQNSGRFTQDKVTSLYQEVYKSVITR